MTQEKWHQRVFKATQRSPLASACALAMCRALEPEAFSSWRTMDLFQATGITFDMRRTHALGLWPPKVTKAMLERYWSFALSPKRTTNTPY